MENVVNSPIKLMINDEERKWRITLYNIVEIYIREVKKLDLYLDSNII